MLFHPKLVLEVISQAFPFDLKHYFHTIAISELLYYDKCFPVVFKIAFSSAMVLCVCALFLTAASRLVFLQPYELAGVERRVLSFK